jgi:site-specific recombinase XerD
MKATFNISYLIQKGKVKANGQAPIMARLIVNNEMIHFSTQMSIEPQRWNPLTYRTVGLTKEEKKINAFLDELTASVQRRYYDLQASGEVVSASEIKQRLFSTDERSMSLIALCDQFIADYEKLVLTQDYGKESYFRYKVCRARVQEFLLTQYKIKDMPLADLDKRFLDKLYLWLRSEHGLNNNTAVKFLHRFSSIFKMARDNGWVTGDPFKLQHLHLDKVDRGYLTTDEIEKIYTHEFDTDRLTIIRDIFIFCCYTGLPYIDCKNLTYDHIITWSDGNQWISIHRTKTKVPVNVRLLEVPLMIMEKYKGVARSNKVLPVPSNQKCNDYLKEIAAVCGINKEITFHVARHTFATTVTLGNGVPIESVSKMLGHTNIKTTQIYARITDQKVNGDMAVLAAKLDAKEHALPQAPKSEELKTAREAKFAQDIEQMGIVPALS